VTGHLEARSYSNAIKRTMIGRRGLWSACLWQIRKAMGRKADKLILSHHPITERRQL
jgi:hypothetical protein